MSTVASSASIFTGVASMRHDADAVWSKAARSRAGICSEWEQCPLASDWSVTALNGAVDSSGSSGMMPPAPSPGARYLKPGMA